jgi:ribosomal protein S18 acetylase RimI-like enzyme
MDQIIRAATDDDSGAITRILRQIWSAIPSDKPAEPGPSDEYLQSIVKGCEIFVIEKGKEVIGLNAVRVMDLSDREDAAFKKVAFMMAIGVDEMHRRQGAGTALVNHMRSWLACLNVEMVSLNVTAQNSTAAAFYSRMGFETMSMQMGINLSLLRKS